MNHLEIKLPIEENAIAVMSFTDVEGIYMLFTKNSGRELLNEVEKTDEPKVKRLVYQKRT